MKKILTILFVFTCLAFSEMRGQAGPVGLRINIINCSNPSFQSVVLSTQDSINYYSIITLLDTSYSMNFEFSPRGNYDDFGYPNYQLYGYVDFFPSANAGFNGNCITVTPGNYFLSFNRNTKSYNFSNAECINSPLNVSPSQVFQTSNSIQCEALQLICLPSYKASNWNYQWRKDGVDIIGANQFTYSAPASIQNSVYSCTLTCPDTNISVPSNSVTRQACFNDVSSSINYLLVQNVTTTGNNATNKTIQVQFDLSWGNTWWDDINWDAAWVFMKYKTAAGEWKHAKINPTGYDKGQGSPSIIQPTADKMGAFIRLGVKGQGNFNAQGMQLQWNYGLDGLSSVNGLEVKVFAIEMVYQPQGDFTLSNQQNDGIASTYFDANFMNFFTGDYWNPNDHRFLTAPNDKVAVVNTRISPSILFKTGEQPAFINGFDAPFKIKGNSGIDFNNDGAVDNTNYPTGYYPFYMFKYELSDQQYADFINCLTSSQIQTLGIAGSSITQSQGLYYARDPNRACYNSDKNRLLAYADWSGLRPISLFELHKAKNGPNPILNVDVDCSQDGKASGNAGSGFYGAKDLAGKLVEPYVSFLNTSFNTTNGDGILNDNGLTDHPIWVNEEIWWFDFSACSNSYGSKFGFRLCRSAE